MVNCCLDAMVAFRRDSTWPLKNLCHLGEASFVIGHSNSLVVIYDVMFTLAWCHIGVKVFPHWQIAMCHLVKVQIKSY